eukprot:6178367-Pleurochrysis_carterae.AAC.1
MRPDLDTACVSVPQNCDPCVSFDGLQHTIDMTGIPFCQVEDTFQYNCCRSGAGTQWLPGREAGQDRLNSATQHSVD